MLVRVYSERFELSLSGVDCIYNCRMVALGPRPLTLQAIKSKKQPVFCRKIFKSFLFMF